MFSLLLEYAGRDIEGVTPCESKYGFSSSHSQGPLPTYLIGYDLNKPGQAYPELIDHLKGYGAWWHNLDSTWLVTTSLTTVALRDDLSDFLDSSDKLLVIRVSGCSAAWTGFSTSASDWMKKWF
jgi:hypothetical protein